MSISYDRVATQYDNYRKIPHEIIENLASKIESKYGNCKKWSLLDVGIGTGRFAIPFSKHFDKIVGIDISSKMIAQFENKSIPLNVQTVVGDITCNNFQDNFFDATLLVSVLHLIGDLTKAMNELRRICKNTSLILLGQTIYSGNDKDLFEHIRFDMIKSDDCIGIPFEKQKDFLSSKFDYLEEIKSNKWTIALSINELIKSIEERLWSETWAYSDNELKQVILQIKEKLINKKSFNTNLDLYGEFVFYVFQNNK